MLCHFVLDGEFLADKPGELSGLVFNSAYIINVYEL